MKIKKFITQNSHLSNEELILLFAKVAYDKGWKVRDLDAESIENWPADIKIRDKWLEELT